MHMCYERPGLVTALNQAVGYDKWDRGGPGVAGGGGGGSAGSWAGRERERERERDRERERQARAHQMSHAHAPEPDASALFPAPVKITGNNDRVSQQIQIKLGDYNIARPLLDDPSKSIGICAEPPSPAPCLQSRRESEFKKPAHAPQNGRIHHRSFYNKNDVPGSTGAPLHRPPPLRISNGIQHQNSIDSSQPPIEHILKEMKSLPTPLSVLAQTPRKEHDNKFIFNPHTNKVEIPQQSNDLKSPPPKPGLDNRISNSISSNSPDVVSKDLGLSESDDEAAATTRLHPILSPIGSGGSPTSDSDSSHSESESESSSTESSTAPTTEPLRGAVDQAPTQRDSWSLSNFAPPSAAISDQSTYEADKQLAHALHDAKGKPSPISELSDSETSSPSPRVERRRSTKPSQSQSSDDERPARNTPSPRVPSASAHVPAKRGRPAKPHTPEERPAKKKRGRPRKVHPPSPPARSTSPPRSPDSDVEPPAPAPAPAPALPPQPPTLADTKMNIFRKVFTPRKGDEGGGKGGKGGKGKGGKGKGQVTIIEVTAPESGADDDDRRHRDRSDERRQNEEAIAARLSPQPEERKRDRDRNPHNRLSERRSAERTERLPYERIQDRLSTERTSTSNDRLSTERTSNDRLQVPNDRISISSDRSDKSSIERRISSDRSERLSGDKSSLERRLSSDRPVERRSADRVSERYVKAEADVGSGLVKAERGSERLAEASSNGSERRSRGGGRVMVRIPLSRLRAETIRALQRAPKRPAPGKHSGTETEEQGGIVAATNHERTGSDQTPLHSCFERLPPPDQPMPLEDRDHKYYLNEAARLRTSAEREQEPLQRVMLYLESVLCFVRTGEVLEQELDTKRAFTIYRETIEYIKSIHSMPQRFRASPHSTFNKLDILSLRVQSLLYLRMFKMYNREVKEYHKIVQEYQQKPAHAESVSPLSPTPSPAGSVGSVGSGSASSGYCSLVHSVPANAHNALLQLTKYYTFLYVAHDLWEHSETLCRQRPNQDLFIAVDRKCGPLTLFSTFRHLVDYVHYAITLLKQSPRE